MKLKQICILQCCSDFGVLVILSTYVSLTAACPVKGQVRRRCAAHPSCHHTCNNTNDPLICPQVCIINGCECPNGTVIDEDTNECVTPRECEGTIIEG